MPTELLERPKTQDTDNDTENVAHIVWAKDPNALILWAMVEGKAIEALCGKMWIPSRMVDNLPVCRLCLEEKRRIQRGG